MGMEQGLIVSENDIDVDIDDDNGAVRATA
jgi:hypothetical protein